jgi:hypothetical protein
MFKEMMRNTIENGQAIINAVTARILDPVMVLKRNFGYKTFPGRRLWE